MTHPSEGSPDDGAPLRPGMVVGGKFALLRRLGEGGVGVVFEAEDTWIGRRVAIKVLHAHLASRADVLARFRREARAAAAMHHPNIVSVFEVGQRHDGSFYIVQELLDGQTLREKIRDKGRLLAGEMIEILAPIMGALASAHQSGIVHRDLKPENIFLARTPSGEVVPKLIDFGVAKMASTELTTLTGSLLGTPAYMSPEQAAGELDADARTDVWSMGAVMYELLSGQTAYDGPTGPVILAKILAEPVPRIELRAPGIAAELAELIHMALERDPSKRHPTMQTFLEALLDYAEKPEPGTSPSRARSFPPPRAALGDATVLAPPPVMPELRLSPDADTEPSGNTPESLPAKSMPEWARPMTAPEVGWYESRPSPRAPRDAEWYAAAAGQALRVNTLDEAIDYAEHAIVTCRAAGELRGQMRLIQAVAFRWLGHYADSERAAIEALSLLERGSIGWYAALGHRAIIAGYVGKNDELAPMAAELAAIEQSGPVGAPHVVAAGRLSISLVRAGLAERAVAVLASARRTAFPGTDEEPVVRAWLDVAAAELSLHTGDPTAYLKHLESAVAGFGETGDARNACLQRANIGNGYMQLGAFARAKAVLREALSVGEPMKLSFIAPVRANLGFTLARLGNLDQALEMEHVALDQCVREGYRRFEIASRLYLSVILALRDQLPEAEREARAAIAAAQGAPPIKAYALATLADMLLGQGRALEALIAAEEGMEILRELSGVEEGEALIRLVHAMSLEATGDTQAAQDEIGEARRRLLERADRITDARLRRSFLDHVPENARTLAFSSRFRTPPR
jgi:serine/threonine protein kinase/tetratricopeptide (TPR) repeat protein